jgi:hypothetical protein
MIQLLIDHGADVCKATQMKCLRSSISCPIAGSHNCNDAPLVVAIDCTASVEIVRLLIEKGADPNAKDHVSFLGLGFSNFEIDASPIQAQETPLLRACASATGRTSGIVQLLLESGAEVHSSTLVSHMRTSSRHGL